MSNSDIVRKLIGQMKGICWDLDNTPQNPGVICWRDEIENITKELKSIADCWKKTEESHKRFVKEKMG